MNLKKLLLILLLLSFVLYLYNKTFIFVFACMFYIATIYFIYCKVKSMKLNHLKTIKDDEIVSTTNENINTYYEIKNYLTASELVFYYKLKKVSEEFIIIPQVPLSSIIKKVNGRYQNELSRVIDFGVFDKNFRLLLLIELNDPSHNKISRRDRDLKVKKILNDCFINLLTFHTKYPNEQEYISKRIKEALNIDKKI